MYTFPEPYCGCLVTWYQASVWPQAGYIGDCHQVDASNCQLDCVLSVNVEVTDAFISFDNQCLSFVAGSLLEVWFLDQWHQS